MLVDSEKAKEKLAKLAESDDWENPLQLAHLIRNTDLSDCMLPEPERRYSGCACVIEEDGGYVEKWCAVHAETRRRAEAAEAQIAELKKDAERLDWWLLRSNEYNSRLSLDAAKESGK